MKPFFIKTPVDVVASDGEYIELRCRVGGDPLPKVTWRRSSGRIPLGRVIIREDRGLRIEGVTAEDHGTYICQAENIVGIIEASAQITVQCKLWFLATF